MSKSAGGTGRKGRARVQTFEQFAGERGANRFAADVATNRLPRASEGQKKRILARQRQVIDENTAKRKALEAEFNQKVASGAIREPTRIEQLISKAQGHPDNPSVQAARRLLNKQGIKF